jgi:hypothetical protein
VYAEYRRAKNPTPKRTWSAMKRFRLEPADVEFAMIARIMNAVTRTMKEG